MAERTVYITNYDYERLVLLLKNMNRVEQNRRDDLSCLEEELERCTLVAPEEVPTDVVTLNSRVKFVDIDGGRERIATLVFPSNADFDKGRISITSPFGAAILGYAAGDVVSWESFSGRKFVRIEEVLYQPEAAGEYHL